MIYSSSCVEESDEEVSIPKEEIDVGEVNYSTPCPWQTGKEDCEVSGILNDISEESFQKDGEEEHPATINGLSCRWAGTEFERVAIACIRMKSGVKEDGLSEVKSWNGYQAIVKPNWWKKMQRWLMALIHYGRKKEETEWMKRS